MLKNDEWKIIKISAGDQNRNIGDDCFVWNEKKLVVTTDHMCEKTHFDLSFMPPESVGWRLMAANASDIISMGSVPTHVLVNIAVPSGGIDLAEKMIKGALKFLDKYGIKIVGGDTTAAPFFMMGATMFGEKPEKPLLRSGAKPGDSIFISSFPGLPKCGLLHLQNNTPGFELSKKRFLFPDPFETAPGNPHILNGAIDISDSLVSELTLLALASKVHLKIDLDAIPVAEEVEKTSKLYNIPVEELLLGSGEEFFLLFTSGNKPDGAYEIGQVYETMEFGVEMFDKNGAFDFSHITPFLHFG